MISLKPYLYGAGTPDPVPTLDSETATIVGCYAGAICAFGKAAAQDGSAHGIQLEQFLSGLGRRVSTKPTAESVAEVARQVLSHVEQWGELLGEDSKAKADETRELLIALAKIAESVGSRDQAYGAEFRELTERLEKVADLNDLAQIKGLLVKHVAELKTSVDQMAQNNQQLVLQLRAQATLYENKLKAAEEIASRDELTGIPNRRYIQRQIAWNIKKEEPFCVLMIDLNGFKEVNDTYGHNAGDDLLKQFSAELRSRTRATDLVGRWGGDEFILIMMSTAEEARICLERLRGWLFGKYLLKGEPDAEVRVVVDAAIGLAEWRNGMNAGQVIAEADARMYEDKLQSRSLNRP